MQARSIARELALLGMSQLSDKPGQLAHQDFQALLQAAVNTLTVEAKDTLETAADELKRGSSQLVDSDIKANDLDSGRSMVEQAITLTQAAINRLATALELPEFIQLTNQKEVRAFAQELLSNAAKYQADVDERLNTAMVAWQLKRLPRIDRDILRLAVVEIEYLGTPDRVAINEAVELAKRYSGEDGYRFINGVLRRVVSGEVAAPSAAKVPDAPIN
ncbi:transcription antitermination factor NusB [Nodosilinea sp. P-1105]|uniref:transcription antitermination factor NusB n=1 Tax=Nodosilinea sp. P-1105 TaxID=2546229 RepID=UPI00146C99A2|nr:transcription antitermination factor NusB [Nodosilinea sp. P-1105]NMF81812.1 transcription antitermination protein NusB [Nodosilinea sp. P-1105]